MYNQVNCFTQAAIPPSPNTLFQVPHRTSPLAVPLLQPTPFTKSTSLWLNSRTTRISTSHSSVLATNNTGSVESDVLPNAARMLLNRLPAVVQLYIQRSPSMPRTGSRRKLFRILIHLTKILSRISDDRNSSVQACRPTPTEQSGDIAFTPTWRENFVWKRMLSCSPDMQPVGLDWNVRAVRQWAVFQDRMGIWKSNSGSTG